MVYQTVMTTMTAEEWKLKMKYYFLYARVAVIQNRKNSKDVWKCSLCTV